VLSIINIEEFDKWNTIIKSFNNYDVYYLSHYVKAFQIHGDGEPLLIYYEDNDIRAINVVMKRDISHDEKFRNLIPNNTYFDIITPYGYGGFILEGNINEDSLSRLNSVYSGYCKDNGIISEFVRFHPVLENYKIANTIYDISILGPTVTVSLNSKDEIWNNFSSKNRNVIRKAIKAGVKIYCGNDKHLFDEFKIMYNTTMDRDNAEQYYYFNDDFYHSVMNDLKNRSLIFYATLEDKIISMSIILFTNKQLHYHLSASYKEYLTYAPTNLLLYEVACWGVDNGYKTFHLGGGLGCKEDSLFKFKAAFNNQSNTKFCIGKKIFDIKKYEELIKIREKDLYFSSSSQFFPLYRAKN